MQDLVQELCIAGVVREMAGVGQEVAPGLLTLVSVTRQDRAPPGPAGLTGIASNRWQDTCNQAAANRPATTAGISSRPANRTGGAVVCSPAILADLVMLLQPVL